MLQEFLEFIASLISFEYYSDFLLSPSETWSGFKNCFCLRAECDCVESVSHELLFCAQKSGTYTLFCEIQLTHTHTNKHRGQKDTTFNLVYRKTLVWECWTFEIGVYENTHVRVQYYLISNTDSWLCISSAERADWKNVLFLICTLFYVPHTLNSGFTGDYFVLGPVTGTKVFLCKTTLKLLSCICSFELLSKTFFLFCVYLCPSTPWNISVKVCYNFKHLK